MSEIQAQEKDNFWLYIILGVAIFAGVIFMVKSSEHDKYQKASELISENPANSAYKN